MDALLIAGYSVHLEWYRPAGSPRAVVLFFPGHGDCAEASEEILSPLLAQGLRVCAVDIPGQGRSSGARGDLPGISLIDELTEQLYESVRALHPALPLGIAGHSMGGHFALRALWRTPTRYDFGWLNAPLLAPELRKSAFEISVLRFLARFFPTFTISSGVRRSDCLDLSESAPAPRPDAPYHQRLSLRMGLALLQSCGALRATYPEVPPSTPLLVTQGTHDPITPAETARPFFTQWPDSPVSYLEIAPGRHEAFRGETRPAFVAIVEEWISQVLTTGPSPSSPAIS